MGWELQNPFMMWCWRKPKILSKKFNCWLFVDDVSTIDHQSWIFVHVYVVVEGWKNVDFINFGVLGTVRANSSSKVIFYALLKFRGLT